MHDIALNKDHINFLSIIQVEGMNSLVSELADVAARERAVLNECELLFGSIAALQVTNSLWLFLNASDDETR